MNGDEIDKSNEVIENIRLSNYEFDYSIDLTDNRIKGYKGYASMTFDLKLVEEFISLLLELKAKVIEENGQNNKINQLTERSLFISSIITYARCFTQTEGRGIKLESRDCFGEHQTSFIQLHKYLMNIRNEYLAHAGVSNSEKIYATANFNIHEADVSMRLSHEIIGQYGLSSKDLFEFLELIKHLLVIIVSKRDAASKAYLDGLTLEEKNELLKEAIERKHTIRH